MKQNPFLRLGALVLSFSLVLGLTALANAAEKTYINGIDANYPPFAFVNETGTPSGFDVESMNWIAKKMGFTVKHQPMDWDGIIPALLAKKIDMVCSGMSISPERSARAQFSEPYWTIRKVLIAKKGSTLTTENIFKGKKIRLGVQRGTNEHEMLQGYQKDKGYTYELRFYDSGPMAIEDLLNGRVDAVGLDSAPAEDAIRKGKAVQKVGIFGPEDVFAVALRKDDTELPKLINEGYKLLKADPYWKELQAKFLK
ncbi:MAG: ABC transporter substrate-binding protein [Bilophila sp.]